MPPETGTMAASVPLAHAPRALDFAPGGKVYFTVTGVDGLEVLDPATNQLAPAPIATSPSGCASSCNVVGATSTGAATGVKLSYRPPAGKVRLGGRPGNARTAPPS